MINTLLGTKSNMKFAFNRLGYQIPVTTIVAEPNIIVGFKKDKAILGYGKKKKSKKTENAFIKIIGYSPRFIKEVQISPESPAVSSQQNQPIKEINLGGKILVSIFEPGDEVKITGITKGKGFAGSVKRWGFAGGPKTHGQSDRHRAPGSIGAGTTPGRVFKGKKMAGHMGNAKLTVRGLEVVEVDENKNVILIKGSVPGPKNGLLIIEKTGKTKGYTLTPAPSEAAKGPLRSEASEPRPEGREKQAEKEAKDELEQEKPAQDVGQGKTTTTKVEGKHEGTKDEGK